MDQKNTRRLISGNEIPVMGVGTWQLTRDTVGTIAKAIELGYCLIDTSGDYGTQPGIRKGIEQSGVPRDELFVTTKVEEDEDAYAATVKNLRELGLSYADLVLIHRPPERGAGEELWTGLIRAQEEGLAKDIGVSNYTMEEIDALIDSSSVVPAVNQIEWSPFGHSEDMLHFANERGIIIEAYSPLTRTERLDDELLTEISAKYRKTPAQILLRWDIQLGVVPIPKANQERHLKENLHIFDFEIADEDMDRLSGLNELYSALGRLAYA